MQPKVQVKLRIEEKLHIIITTYVCTLMKSFLKKSAMKIWDLIDDVLSYANFLWPKLELTVGWINCKICKTLRADDQLYITP